jgi:hypothetical protein
MCTGQTYTYEAEGYVRAKNNDLVQSVNSGRYTYNTYKRALCETHNTIWTYRYGARHAYNNNAQFFFLILVDNNICILYIYMYKHANIVMLVHTSITIYVCVCVCIRIGQQFFGLSTCIIRLDVRTSPL